MHFNSNCRVCLEDTALNSIFSTEFAMLPCDMMMLCSKIRISKNDGLPTMICNNCIYRLGVAYHFKQQLENSDLRLRQYYGMTITGMRDAEVMTDDIYMAENHHSKELEKSFSDDRDDDAVELKKTKYKTKSRRYKRKEPEERKKRGPKPKAKIPQACYECHKVFQCSAQLEIHIRTHTGEKPFSCNFCPRRFAQKHNLAIHLRIHTGERPFQCEICSKQFTALGNLQTHSKIHVGIRDQVCHICNKGFINSGDLARHLITHSGIKNHPCDVCGKAFTRNRDMLVHKKKIHSSNDNRAPHIETIHSTINSAPPPVAVPAIGGVLPSTISISTVVQGTLGLVHSQRLHPFLEGAT